LWSWCLWSCECPWSWPLWSWPWSSPPKW
jgi:hypothetical protein